MADHHHEPADHQHTGRQASSGVDVVVPRDPPVLTPSAAAVLLRILRAAVRKPKE